MDEAEDPDQTEGNREWVYPALAYLSSAVALHFLFLSTMLIHYDGRIDWRYLAFASLQILAMSIVPAALVYLVKAKKSYPAVLLGVFFGVAVAIASVSWAI